MTRCAMFDSKMLQLARLAAPWHSHHACTLQPSGEVQRAAAVQRFGIILGTLGRQGNPAILNRLEAKLKAAGKQYFVLLLSEIFPKKVQRTCECHTHRHSQSRALSPHTPPRMLHLSRAFLPPVGLLYRD